MSRRRAPVTAAGPDAGHEGAVPSSTAARTAGVCLIVLWAAVLVAARGERCWKKLKRRLNIEWSSAHVKERYKVHAGSTQSDGKDPAKSVSGFVRQLIYAVGSSGVLQLRVD